MAHALLLEQFTEQVRLQQQHALMLDALGGEAEIPDLDARVEAFEADLAEQPDAVPGPPVDVEREELHAALGLPNRLGGGRP